MPKRRSKYHNEVVGLVVLSYALLIYYKKKTNLHFNHSVHKGLSNTVKVHPNSLNGFDQQLIFHVVKLC